MPRSPYPDEVSSANRRILRVHLRPYENPIILTIASKNSPARDFAQRVAGKHCTGHTSDRRGPACFVVFTGMLAAWQLLSYNL